MFSNMKSTKMKLINTKNGYISLHKIMKKGARFYGRGKQLYVPIGVSYGETTSCSCSSIISLYVNGIPLTQSIS